MAIEYLETPVNSRDIVVVDSLRARFADLGDRTSVEISPKSMNPDRPNSVMNIYGIVYPQPCMLELDYEQGRIESIKYTTTESPVETHYLWDDGILVGSDTLYSASQKIITIPKVSMSNFRISDHFGNLVSRTSMISEIDDYMCVTTTYTFADFDGKYESRDKFVVAKFYEGYKRNLIKPAFGLQDDFFVGVPPMYMNAFKCDSIDNQEIGVFSDNTFLKYNRDFDDYVLSQDI